MIHKVETLISIGKFVNYTASGDVTFKKFTLIYADNGSGKTTLAAVLRSLTENNPEIVRKRVTAGTGVVQSIRIVQRNTTGDTQHTFGASGWSGAFPGIEIFDTHFVNDNIYSGFEFNEDQKRHLHDFVIGAQGVILKQQIEQNKEDKSGKRQQINLLFERIKEEVGHNLTWEIFPPFLNIPVSESADIDSRIKEATNALVSAKANATIQTLPILTAINVVNTGIQFQEIITDLELTLQTIQNNALETVFSDHCADLVANTVTNPNAWLKVGHSYIVSKGENRSCPFCKQPVEDNLEILRAYALRFNEQFNALAQRVSVHLSKLQKLDVVNLLQNIVNANTVNSSRVASWQGHLAATVIAPTLNFLPTEEVVRLQLQEATSEISSKVQNPSIAAVSDRVGALRDSIAEINNGISAYNQQVSIYNNGINSFRSTLQTESAAQIELDRLHRIKSRHDSGVDAMCTQMRQENEDLKTLEVAYRSLTAQQEAAAVAFFGNYQTRINHYLENVFRTPFKIENVEHIPPQGKATQSKMGYRLTMGGHDISFDSNQVSNTRDCLSEGDRSTLALALFLAKLDLDPQKIDKILIFDDPLSSLDTRRRMYTVQLIKELLPQLKQIVVLSHNEHFLFDLSKGILAADKKILRIIENFFTCASSLEPLLLETLVENGYFKHLKELEDFLATPDIIKKERILGLMRNVLEAHMRFKFRRQTTGIPEHRKTFGRLIDHLDTNGIVLRDNGNRGTIFARLRIINEVSLKPHHGDPLPDYTTLGIDPATMSVAELANLVTDTLDFVDNKL